MTTRKRLVSSSNKEPLTSTEDEFLRLFTVERLSLRLAARRRGCSYENARQFRSILIKKGYMDARYNLVSSTLSTQGGKPKDWTVDGFEVVADVIAYGDRRVFEKKRGVAQGIFSCRGSTVMLYPDKVHVKVGQVFSSEHPRSAFWKAAEYVFSVLRVLEFDLDVLLVKDRRANMRIVAGEIAHGPDRLALKEGAQHLRVVDDATGKVRIKVDWSPGSYPEVEFVSSQTNLGDAEKYEDFLGDLVSKQHYQLSELSRILQTSVEMHARAASQLEVVSAQMVTLTVNLNTLLKVSILKQNNNEGLDKREG